jgi:L-seryl-tRNA(Ser) seleniumtransferase
LCAIGVRCTVVDTATVGGERSTARIPSAALALDGDAAALDAALRASDVPVIGRIADGRLLIDLRSVPASFDAALHGALGRALSGTAVRS